MLAFLLTVTLSVLPSASPNGLTAAPDTVLSPIHAEPDAEPEPEYTLRVPITSIYSGTYGFGLAGGIRLSSGSTAATLDARLAQYYQAAALTLDTHDAQTARVFGRIRGVAASQSRWRYHGIGPKTDGSDRVDLDLASMQAVAALGVRPLTSPVLTLQPSVGVRYDDFAAPTDEQRRDIGAFSINAQNDFSGSDGQGRWALTGGLTAEVDTRDHRDYPSSGALVSAGARHLTDTDSDFDLTRYDVSVVGFLPLGQRVVLFGRASGTVSNSTSTVETPLPPVYYLPTLDADGLAGFPLGRFRGNDLALFSVGARVPIIDALGTYGIDATVTASAGNAYRDVFEEFTARIATSSDVDDFGIGAPLRPVLGLGLALVNIPKGRIKFGGTVGLGPEGFTLFAFRLATGLGDDLPVIW